VSSILVGLFVVIIVSVARLAAVLPEYAKEADDLVSGINDFLARFGVEPGDLSAVTDSLDVGKIVDLIGGILGTVGSITTSLVFLFSVLLFLSFEADQAGARILAIATDRPRIAEALGEFARGTRNYLIVSTVFGLVIAILDTIALMLLGIPLPVLWGVLSFITNYIPNVGFIIGLIPPALLGLLGGGWGLALAVIVVYILLNFVGQSLIQPRFVGNAVGLSTTVAFLALLFWAWLIGPLGAILAIPLTLLAKALLVDVDPGARWADAFLGVQRPPSSPRRRRSRRRRSARSKQDEATVAVASADNTADNTADPAAIATDTADDAGTAPTAGPAPAT
jgi:AI-2 transport protein TqsA